MGLGFQYRIKWLVKLFGLRIGFLGILAVILYLFVKVLLFIAEVVVGNAVQGWINSVGLWWLSLYPSFTEIALSNPWSVGLSILLLVSAVVLFLSYIESRPPRGIKIDRNYIDDEYPVIGIRLRNSTGDALVLKYADLQLVNKEDILLGINDSKIELPEPITSADIDKKETDLIDLVIEDGKSATIIVGIYIRFKNKSQYNIGYNADIRNGDLLQIQIGAIKRSTGKSFSTPITVVMQIMIDDDDGHPDIVKISYFAPIKWYPKLK